MMTNDQLSAALEALPGERITPDYMKSRIARGGLSQPAGHDGHDLQHHAR